MHLKDIIEKYAEPKILCSEAFEHLAKNHPEQLIYIIRHCWTEIGHVVYEGYALTALGFIRGQYAWDALGMLSVYRKSDNPDLRYHALAGLSAFIDFDIIPQEQENYVRAEFLESSKNDASEYLRRFASDMLSC